MVKLLFLGSRSGCWPRRKSQVRPILGSAPMPLWLGIWLSFTYRSFHGFLNWKFKANDITLCWPHRIFTPFFFQLRPFHRLNLFYGCDLGFVNDVASHGVPNSWQGIEKIEQVSELTLNVKQFLWSQESFSKERRLLFAGETVVQQGSTVGTLFVLEHGRVSIQAAKTTVFQRSVVPIVTLDAQVLTLSFFPVCFTLLGKIDRTDVSHFSHLRSSWAPTITVRDLHRFLVWARWTKCQRVIALEFGSELLWLQLADIQHFSTWFPVLLHFHRHLRCRGTYFAGHCCWSQCHCSGASFNAFISSSSEAKSKSKSHIDVGIKIEWSHVEY